MRPTNLFLPTQRFLSFTSLGIYWVQLSLALLPLLLLLGPNQALAFSTRYVCQDIDPGDSPSDTELPRQPNIILINLDDVNNRLFTERLIDNYFPNIKRMSESGIRFTNLHCTTPLCGPSRAALFRGQYAFETGVKSNLPNHYISAGFPGGYGEFTRQGFHQDELGVWLKNAGYRTLLVGKYHHSGFDGKRPPGYDVFHVSGGSKYFGTFRLKSDSESTISVGHNLGAEEYRTTVESDDVNSLISNHVHQQSDTPFFMYFAPLAAHRPDSRDVTQMVDKVKYGDFASDEMIAATPDWLESDFSDKPPHLQIQELSLAMDTGNQTEHLSRIRALKSFDDGLGQILDNVQALGIADNTYIFLTSDNGYQLGHHRVKAKRSPYVDTANVPCIVIGPSIPAAVDANHLLAHIDLCPTILELAEVEIPESVTAKSFAPLLSSPTTFDEATWQDAIMIENWGLMSTQHGKIPGGYAALRMYDSIFVSWQTGDFEYYDLHTDPFQLETHTACLIPVNDRA